MNYLTRVPEFSFTRSLINSLDRELNFLKLKKFSRLKKRLHCALLQYVETCRAETLWNVKFLFRVFYVMKLKPEKERYYLILEYDYIRMKTENSYFKNVAKRKANTPWVKTTKIVLMGSFKRGSLLQLKLSFEALSLAKKAWLLCGWTHMYLRKINVRYLRGRKRKVCKLVCTK